MREGGYYNQHSPSQRKGVTSIMDHIAEAARTVSIPEDNKPFRISDLGSSQGSNSIPPVSKIIEVVRERCPGIPVSVLHNDLPTNDFQALFEVVHSRESFTHQFDDVYVAACGQSYYRPMSPPGDLHFVIALTTLHWAPFTVDFGPTAISERDPSVSHEVREQSKRLAAESLKGFLLARASECATGGKVVASMVGLPEQQGGGPEDYIFELLTLVFQSMVRDGLMQPSELARLNFNVHQRSLSEIHDVLGLEPLKKCFRVDNVTNVLMEHPALEAWREGKISREEYAEAVVASWCAVAEPTWLSVFEAPGDQERAREEVPRRLKEMLVSDHGLVSFNWCQNSFVLTKL